MTEFCFTNHNLYKKHDLLWDTLSYIARSYSDVKCVVTFQEISQIDSRQFARGLSGKLDRIAKVSPVKRTNAKKAWKCDKVANLLTCYKRSDFPGFIERFDVEREDFFVTVTKCGDKTIGVINCHQTNYGVPDMQLYLVTLFASVMRLQSGGGDAKGREWDAVDGILLAGDLNLKNMYCGKTLDRSKPPHDPKNKIQLQLCYLFLLSELRPVEWQDTARGFEIDYLCTSQNFKYLYEVKIKIPDDPSKRSDHTPYGAVYSLAEPLTPCSFAADTKNEKWEELIIHLTHKINARKQVVKAVTTHLDSLP